MFAKGSENIVFSFVAAALLADGLAWFTGRQFPILTGMFLTTFAAFTIFFFRDPERAITKTDGILSPADGRVIVSEPGRLRIFLSPFDVHVNRAPISGKVKRIQYRPGKFMPAFMGDISENECEDMVFDSRLGQVKIVRQAGIFARRITTLVKEGHGVKAGDRLGMIRFGSSCEIFLPKGFEPAVGVGDRAVGGITVIAEPSKPSEGSATKSPNPSKA